MQGLPYAAVVTPMLFSLFSLSLLPPSLSVARARRHAFFSFFLTRFTQLTFLSLPRHTQTPKPLIETSSTSTLPLSRTLSPPSPRAPALLWIPNGPNVSLAHLHLPPNLQAGKATWQTERSASLPRDQWKSQLPSVWPRRGRHAVDHAVCVPTTPM